MEVFLLAGLGQTLTTQTAVSNTTGARKSLSKCVLSQTLRRDPTDAFCFPSPGTSCYGEGLWQTAQGHRKQIPPRGSDPGAEPDASALKLSAPHAPGAPQDGARSRLAHNPSPSLCAYQPLAAFPAHAVREGGEEGLYQGLKLFLASQSKSAAWPR